MAKQRTSVRMKNQIKELHDRGYSLRGIARSLKVSRKTVRRALALAAMAGEPGDPGAFDGGPDWRLAVPWEPLREQVLAKGVTIQQLHREYAPDVSYVSFWRALRRRLPVAPEVRIRLEHKIGERTQCDFADGLAIVDRRTGAKRKTQFFCGVLGFSSFVYGEFVWDQKQASFLSAQDRMWAYFGGVTPYLVIDNLKSGVTKADWYDPDVNQTFCDYANHMGFAVLPARPYRPRDKAKSESQIGVIQRSFYQEVRGRTFYSLDELNRAFWNYLKRLNQSLMKDYGVSRFDRYQEEKKHLQPLPATRFEQSEWRQAKVHPDCHIQVEKNFYSVPYRFVGQTVKVRLTEKLLEVFELEGEALAVHGRLKGVGRFSTHEAHYPPAKLAAARFDLHQAKQQAQQIGPQTAKLVAQLFEQSHPLRYLRRVQGILRLIKSKQLSREALEYASLQALTFNRTRLDYIKTCALYYQKNGRRPSLAAPVREPSTIHLHQQQPHGGKS